MELITKTPLRSYQTKACSMAVLRSMIIILPTGAGKTLIAANVAKEYILNKKLKVLFVVPTRLLVDQQASSLRYETDLNVATYMGNSAVPLSFDIIVSTPSAFLLLQEANEAFKYNRFGLIIFDEVHHVVKKHPYRSIAMQLNNFKEKSIFSN
jgi:superfamily II DNA or RNA helicase